MEMLCMKCQTISFLGVGVIFDPLTFITFWANSACDKVVVVLVYPENRIWHFMQTVFIGDNIHEMSNPVLKIKHTGELIRTSIWWLYFFSLHKNISCGYSLDEPHQGSSNEYSLHVFASPRCIKLIPTTYVLMENWRKLSHIYVVCKTFTQSAKGLIDKYYANSRHKWVLSLWNRIVFMLWTNSPKLFMYLSWKKCPVCTPLSSWTPVWALQTGFKQLNYQINNNK